MLGFLRRNQCEKIRDLLSPYIDGRLSPVEKRQVEQHLQVCEECSRELEGLRLTVSFLREIPQVQPPRSFALSPGVAKRPASAFVAMRFATGAAAFLLSVLLLGDFVGAFSASTAMKSSAPAMQYAPSSATESQGAPPPLTQDRAATKAEEPLGATAPAAAQSQEKAAPPADYLAPNAIQPSPQAEAGGTQEREPLTTRGAETPAGEGAARPGGLPVKEAELAVAGVAVVLLASTVLLERRRRSV